MRIIQSHKHRRSKKHKRICRKGIAKLVGEKIINVVFATVVLLPQFCLSSSCSSSAPPDYELIGEQGPVKLSALFGDKNTLVVQHFMYARICHHHMPFRTSPISSHYWLTLPKVRGQLGQAVRQLQPVGRWRAGSLPTSAAQDRFRARRQGAHC